MSVRRDRERFEIVTWLIVWAVIGIFICAFTIDQDDFYD